MSNRIFVPALRVLVVDDHSDSADAAARLIGSWGFDAAAATDGDSALQAFHKFQPQAILLDLDLPGKSGFEIARLIRQEDRGQEVYLAAITGFNTPQAKEHCQRAGFDLFFAKPIDTDGLYQFLAEVASRRESQRP